MDEIGRPPPTSRRRHARAMTGAGASLGILGAAAAPSAGAAPAPPRVPRPATSNAFGRLTPAEAIGRIVAATAAFIVAVVLATWALGGFAGLSGAGDAALILGIAVTLALGVGLMALVFYSSRSEQDEAVRDATAWRATAGAKPSAPAPAVDPVSAGQPSL